MLSLASLPCLYVKELVNQCVLSHVCDPGFLTLSLSTDLAVKELNKGGKK